MSLVCKHDGEISSTSTTTHNEDNTSQRQQQQQRGGGGGSVIPRGPDPILISRKQVDTLYKLLHAVRVALDQLVYTEAVEEDPTENGKAIDASIDDDNINHSGCDGGNVTGVRLGSHSTTTRTLTTPISYIITGGSLLGAIRQHSVLFTDDDVDIAIIEQQQHQQPLSSSSSSSLYYPSCLEIVRKQLPTLLGPEYQYTVDAWEGSDRVRYKQQSNVFLDIFCIRQYTSETDLRHVLSNKKNGQNQRVEYVNSILTTIYQSLTIHNNNNTLCISDQVDDTVNAAQQQQQVPSGTGIADIHGGGSKLADAGTNMACDNCDCDYYPLWHFNNRKAIELWPKEVYRPYELFPIQRTYKMGPEIHVSGPHLPLTLLYRAFGTDCLTVYYQSQSHNHNHNNNNPNNSNQQQQQQQPPPLLLVEDPVQRSQTEQPRPSTSENTTSHLPTNDSGSSPTTSGAANTGNQCALSSELPPHVLPGGTWVGGQKLPLLPHHYIPIQPSLRSQRRPTLHNQQSLERFVQEQMLYEVSTQHQQLQQQRLDDPHNNNGSKSLTPPNPKLMMSAMIPSKADTSSAVRPRRTVYMDGVFDLFHVGHLHAIEQCAALGDRVIIGVTGDMDAASYKRPPIIRETDRVAIIEALSIVQEVICPCPLVVSHQFMLEHDIDLVVHGFANPDDANKQAEFFRVPMQLRQFEEINYYDGLSTSDIIERIQKLAKFDKAEGSASSLVRSNASNPPNPKWFGATLAAATSHQSNIPYDPFPIDLRCTIEPHIAKARINRANALATLCPSTEFDPLLSRNEWCAEGCFSYDTQHYPFRETLLRCGNLSADLNIAQLHTHIHGKDTLCQSLTSNYEDFQQVYDSFVRNVCAPKMASSCHTQIKTIYYQAFPCLRIVQPGDFSIGPHADISYGHHPGSMNFYVNLTQISGTSASLFVESRPGSEDWHPILTQDDDYGTVKHFPGAECIHWTTENCTDQTRVSLDFRLIPGHIFHSVATEGGVYSHGYYSCCQRSTVDNKEVWERTHANLIPPDARAGFPWTVKDWDAYRSKHLSKSPTEN